MGATYGDLVGGVVQIRSISGGDRFKFGVQGVVPRPRFTTPGFGRIEGIFPRIYGGGARLAGRLRYFAAAEHDYERIPVPEVTTRTGPDVVEKSSVAFWRVDLQATPRDSASVEGFLFPSATRSKGLSPRRDQSATADFASHDAFAGFTNHLVIADTSVLTLQLSALRHDTSSMPNGAGVSHLTPSGWHDNWFATVTRKSARYAVKAVWERTAILGRTSHDVTVAGEIAARRLTGTVEETPILVSNAAGRLVRWVEFDPRTLIGARDMPVGAAARDAAGDGGRRGASGPQRRRNRLPRARGIGSSALEARSAAVRQLRPVVGPRRVQRFRDAVPVARGAAAAARRDDAAPDRRPRSHRRLGNGRSARTRPRVAGRGMALGIPVHRRRSAIRRGRNQPALVSGVHGHRSGGLQDVHRAQAIGGPRHSAVQRDESLQPARRVRRRGRASVGPIREQRRPDPARLHDAQVEVKRTTTTATLSSGNTRSFSPDLLPAPPSAASSTASARA